MSDLTCEQLDTLITVIYNQLINIQTQKTNLLSLLATLILDGNINSDSNSVSSAGGEGSESYSKQSLTQKIEQLANVEMTLQKVLEEQILLKRKLFSFNISTYNVIHDRLGFGCGFGNFYGAGNLF